LTTESKYNSDILQPQTEGVSLHSVGLRLLSVNEARKVLGIRFESLKKIINDGKISIIVIEGKIKISELALRQFILDNSKPLKPIVQQPQKNVPQSINETVKRIINKYK
jgi:hypothetical protein